jgi:hypothetical protein
MQRHPLHIEHEGFAHFNLAFLPQVLLHPREEDGFATAHHARHGHDTAIVDKLRQHILSTSGHLSRPEFFRVKPPLGLAHFLP